MAESEHATVRPHRTRATWITYFHIGLWVWVLYSFGPSLQSVHGETPMASTLLAIYGAAAALGSIVGGLLFVKLTHLLGRGRVLRLSSVIIVAAVAIYTSGMPAWITIIGPFIAGAGGTFLIAGSNAYLTESQADASAAAITESNTVAATFMIIGPIAVGTGAAIATWGWRFGPWLAALCIVVLEIVRGRSLEPYDAQTGHPDSEPGVDHPHGGRMPLRFWWVLLTLVTLIAVEFSLNTWGATLLNEQGGLSTAAAAAAVGCLTGGVLIGRIIGSRLSETVSTEVLLPVSIAICLVGFLIMWLSSSAVVMLIGFFIAGLGMSLHWPMGITRTLRASQGRPDRAGAFVGIGVGITASAGPILLGLAAGAWGVHRAFWLVPIVLVLALVLALAVRVPDPLQALAKQRAVS